MMARRKKPVNVLEYLKKHHPIRYKRALRLVEHLLESGFKQCGDNGFELGGWRESRYVTLKVKCFELHVRCHPLSEGWSYCDYTYTDQHIAGVKQYM
jgi:tRNA(Phe) wybutosine-synthesizing methylase Tyw3